MRNRVFAAVFLIACLLKCNFAHAVTMTVGGPGPFTAADSSALTSVLYAGREDRGIKPVVAIGDAVSGGVQIDEIGVPAITEDGRVLFGAAVSARGGRPNWDIFLADPKLVGAERLSRPLSDAGRLPGCTPRFKEDPFPVADDEGSIIFAAPEASGGDAVFIYDAGEIRCLARQGDRTDHGHILTMLGFGSLQAVGNRQVAMQGVLDGDRRAVLLVSPGSGVREVAVESAATSSGARFGHQFGLTAMVLDGKEPVLAFTNVTSKGGELFIYRNGVTTVAISHSSRTDQGRVSFISPGRPALSGDGAVAVTASCSRKQMILKTAAGKSRPVIVENPNGLRDFADPVLLDAGTLLVSADDVQGHPWLYRLSPDLSLTQLWPSPFTEVMLDGTEAPSVFGGTLVANLHGDFAFLGSK